MKILIVNLSPRPLGTSNVVAEYLKDRILQLNQAESNRMSVQVEIDFLYKNLNSESLLLDKIQKADILVLSGPCYVNSYPAETISLLEQMTVVKGVLHGQKLYGFIQGGMPYIHTHISGLNLLKNFATKENVIWQGGFVMGGGAMLDGRSLDHIVGAQKLISAINQFADTIYHAEVSAPELYENATTKMPGLMAFVLSKCMGHMIRKKYRAMGIDYRKPSPYRM